LFGKLWLDQSDPLNVASYSMTAESCVLEQDDYEELSWKNTGADGRWLFPDVRESLGKRNIRRTN
jgi:hypothetical protein